MFYNSKSPETFSSKDMEHKLDLLLKEQVHQRKDLSVLNALLKTVMNNQNLQRQVDEYFEDDPKNIPEDEKDKHNGSG